MGQNNSEVCAFVHYGYTPFSRVQCIKRLLFIWAAAWIPCAMSGHRIAAGAVMLLCISAVTGLFLRLIRHHPTEIASRFLCDAVTYTYHALVCNVLSYQVLRRAAGARWPVQLVLLLILLLGIAGMALAVRRSIRCGRYSASADGPVSMALPVIGGTVGLFAAKLLLPAADQTLLPFLLSAILLLFSLGLGIGSLNFVKWMFVRKNRAMF